MATRAWGEARNAGGRLRVLPHRSRLCFRLRKKGGDAGLSKRIAMQQNPSESGAGVWAYRAGQMWEVQGGVDACGSICVLLWGHSTHVGNVLGW